MTDTLPPELRSLVEYSGPDHPWTSGVLHLARERDDFREQLFEDRAVCICGCPNDQHESVGGPEDGEQCENEEHQCLRVSVFVQSEIRDLRAALARTEADREDLIRRDRAASALMQKLEREAAELRAIVQLALDHAPNFGRWMPRARAIISSRSEGSAERSDRARAAVKEKE